MFKLQTINAADIATVRKLGKPPYLITLIMDAVVLLFRKRIDTIKPDPEREFLTASWGESLKVLYYLSSTRFAFICIIPFVKCLANFNIMLIIHLYRSWLTPDF